MPEFVVDRFDGGDAEVVTVEYADLPRYVVEQMARLGDDDATTWLAAHPVPRYS